MGDTSHEALTSVVVGGACQVELVANAKLIKMYIWSMIWATLFSVFTLCLGPDLTEGVVSHVFISRSNRLIFWKMVRLCSVAIPSMRRPTPRYLILNTPLCLHLYRFPEARIKPFLDHTVCFGLDVEDERTLPFPMSSYHAPTSWSGAKEHACKVCVL